MTGRGPALGLIAALALGAVGASGLATPADPAVAQAQWTWAQDQAGDDLAAEPYLDAAKAAHRLRPWHPGFREARARLAAIDRARRR